MCGIILRFWSNHDPKFLTEITGAYTALTNTKTINVHFSQLLSGAYNHELRLTIIQA